MRTQKRTPAAGAAKASPTSGGRYQTVSETAPRVAEARPAALARSVRVISATEAARNFSDLINRVSYKGETYVVERGGRPACQLSPVETCRCSGADLLHALSALPRPSEEFLAAVEELTRNQAAVEPSAWEK
jgi:antitoxin (DNA-binding transcriptional repressor) of toxin-antitoxin stability system